MPRAILGTRAIALSSRALSEQNAQTCPVDIYFIISQYSYVFRFVKVHHQGIKLSNLVLYCVTIFDGPLQTETCRGIMSDVI